MQLRILYQDRNILAIDKPAGFHVHTPEGGMHRISRSVHTIQILERQLNRRVFNVHRLDRATSGVLLCAFDSETARHLSQQFQAGTVQKKYFALARGFLDEPKTVERPLEDEEKSFESKTDFVPIFSKEIEVPLSKYPTTRFSLLQAIPYTGRRHQIRRHLSSLGYPIVGDTVYGSGSINRWFREQNMSGLWLKAYSLQVIHPVTGEPILFSSRWNGSWHRLFDWMGVCGWVTQDCAFAK